MTDYYKVLEVDRNASGEDIKKSYRNLAKKYHPDKKDGSEDRFKAIQEAYSVLGDNNKRIEYDNRNNHSNMFGGGFGNDFFSSFFRGGGFRTRVRVDDFDTFTYTNENFDFAENHYNQTGKSEPKKPKKKKGSDLKVIITLTPENTTKETHKTIIYNRKVMCDVCDGEQTVFDACDVCGGDGSECIKCNSSGLNEHVCYDCSGRGFVTKEEEIKINVPRGCTIGTSTRISGLGNQGTNKEFGDLIIEVGKIVSSEKFRVGQNYRIENEGYINFFDACTGTTIKIETLDGEIEYKLEPFQAFDGNVIVLPNMGIPVNSGSIHKTDHIHFVRVEYPAATENVIDGLKNLKSEIYGNNYRTNIEENPEQEVQGESEDKESLGDDSE